MVDGGPWAGRDWAGSGTRDGSTAVMDSMRLHRRPVGSALVVVWQRILFQEVPGGMLMNGSVEELELSRWGLFGVHWYWSSGIGFTWE